MIALLLLFFVALGAGVLSGVVGTGSSLIMLPVLVATYGPRIAVPVMAIASLFGNIGRVIVWWHEIRWRPVFAYSLAGVPAAVLGAHTLLTISPGTVGIPGSFLPCDDPAAPSHQTIEPPLESLAHEFGRGDCRVYDRIRAVHRAAQRAGIYRVRNEWRRIFGIRGGKRNPALRWQASYVRYIGRTRAACPHTWTCHRHRIVRRFDDCETSRPETPDAYVRASH